MSSNQMPCMDSISINSWFKVASRTLDSIECFHCDQIDNPECIIRRKNLNELRQLCENPSIEPGIKKEKMYKLFPKIIKDGERINETYISLPDKFDLMYTCIRKYNKERQ